MHINLLILFVAISISSYSQNKYIEKITLVETQQNEKKLTIKKILMVGAGSIESRFFLDKLATKIKQDFKKNNVELDYNYLGKINKDSSIQINKMLYKNYDAILVFNPVDTSNLEEKFVTERYGYNPPSGGYVGVNVSKRTIKYIQRFDISIYDNEMGTLWAAILKITIDYSKDKNYSIISDKIMKELMNNKLLL